jgi:hypothetical protein
MSRMIIGSFAKTFSVRKRQKSHEPYSKPPAPVSNGTPGRARALRPR